MRALTRAPWLVPAVCLPLCIALASLGIQAAAFSRPTRDAIVAARVLRSLLDYRVVRATETIGNTTHQSICLQGWFRDPGERESQRGALVLIDNRERLYDFGKGVRRVGSRGLVPLREETQFQLAGCPRFIGAKIGDRLVRGSPVDVDAGRVNGRPADEIAFGESTRMDLAVTTKTYVPIRVTLFGNSYHASSELRLGGTHAIVRRMRGAFPLFTSERHA